MGIDRTELDRMQSSYKTAVNEWINAIRREETLASEIHDVAEVDKWEEAADREEEARSKGCEGGLRVRAASGVLQCLKCNELNQLLFVSGSSMTARIQ